MFVLRLWQRFFKSENPVLGDDTQAFRDFGFHYEQQWFAPYRSHIHRG